MRGKCSLQFFPLVLKKTSEYHYHGQIPCLSYLQKISCILIIVTSVRVYISLLSAKIAIFLEIVMNELRRFMHSADLLANSSHIIESAAISVS